MWRGAKQYGWLPELEAFCFFYVLRAEFFSYTILVRQLQTCVVLDSPNSLLYSSDRGQETA